MIKTSVMSQRAGEINANCQMLFKFNEKAGNPVDSVSGSEYDVTDNFTIPADYIRAGDSFVNWDVDQNGAWIQNDSSALNVKIDTSNIEFSMAECFVMAAVVKTKANTLDPLKFQPRMNIGSVDVSKSVITISLGGGMHIILLMNDVNGNNADTKQLTSALKLPENQTFVIVVYWDGTTSTLTGKCLNLDGTVYNDGTTDFVLSIISAPLYPLFKPDDSFNDNAARWNDGIYYAAVAASYKTMPDNIDYKIAQWATESIKGNKGWAVE